MPEFDFQKIVFCGSGTSTDRSGDQFTPQALKQRAKRSIGMPVKTQDGETIGSVYDASVDGDHLFYKCSVDQKKANCLAAFGDPLKISSAYKVPTDSDASHISDTIKATSTQWNRLLLGLDRLPDMDNNKHQSRWRRAIQSFYL